MIQGGNILVVDDEPAALKLLVGILTAEGYRVRPADSGKLALASVAAEPPELILLDIRMPGMNGFEVYRRLKACESSRDTPVIFVTAAREVEERVEGLRLGAVDFISKTFHPEEILARVRTHLELGRLRVQLERRVAQRTQALSAANEQLQRELTQRIRAEHALRESEERFRHIADSAPVIIWVSGPDGTNTFFNKQASVFTGRTVEELRGTGWHESIHPEDVERRSLLCIRAIQGQKDFQLEYRMRRADGEYRWVLSTGVARFINGSYMGHVGTILDVTDFKRNHERMLETQKLESLGVLAAGIAHDFNNLLGSIFGETDLALLDVPQDSPARESIERIGALVIRASEIVKLLMAYAGDGCDVMSEPVDLGYLVEEMLRLLKLSISKRAVMKVNMARDLPVVQANAPQIRQVVMNLITNASEALEDREGLITVTTSRVYMRAVDSRNGSTDLAEGDYVRLEVSDTGCGIAEETQARVFDPFYTTKFLGRGLGLAAVRGIVRGHRGAINIVSVPGRGSTFEVLLPCARQQADEHAEVLPVSESGRRTNCETILVVEDEDALRNVICKALERAGYRVLATANGREAVALFRAHPQETAAVLLDITLPGMSGPEVFAAIRRDNPDVKIILTSACCQEDVHADGYFGGERPLFLRKPYLLRDLVSTIRTLTHNEAASKTTFSA